MVRRGFDLEDFHKIVELADGAISPDGHYVAFVSTHWDLEADEFVKKVQVLAVHREGPLLEKLWSASQAGIRTLRFSPNNQFLAFLRASSSTNNPDDELVVYELSTGQTKVIFTGKDLADLVWSPASNALFCCCETSSTLATNGVQYVDSIPKRLPWWHKQMQVHRISFTGMDTAKELSEPVSPELVEIGQLCISPDGETLAFIEERCENGSKITLYLHRINLENLSQAPALMLPNSFITTPIFSPSGQYIAYVGARVKDLGQTPVPLHSYLDSAMAQNGYGINVYDVKGNINRNMTGHVMKPLIYFTY